LKRRGLSQRTTNLVSAMIYISLGAVGAVFEPVGFRFSLGAKDATIHDALPERKENSTRERGSCCRAILFEEVVGKNEGAGKKIS